MAMIQRAGSSMLPLRRHFGAVVSLSMTSAASTKSSPLTNTWAKSTMRIQETSSSPYHSQLIQVCTFSTTPVTLDSSSGGAAGDDTVVITTTRQKKKGKKHNFVPKKAAVQMTKQAREFFRKLVEMKPEKAGVMLNYDQSKTGEPRMVFSFDFVTKEQLHPRDEGVSLEILEDGSPKPPEDALNDGLPKLYIHHNAFLKVLGTLVDVDLQTMTPIIYDREGNKLDPNA